MICVVSLSHDLGEFTRHSVAQFFSMSPMVIFPQIYVMILNYYLLSILSNLATVVSSLFQRAILRGTGVSDFYQQFVTI